MDSKSVLPSARTAGILCSALDDESLIYDERTQSAAALSPLATATLQWCDGRSTLAEAIAGVRSKLGDDISTEAVIHALQLLSKHDLLDGPLLLEAPTWSRRSLIRKGMIAGLAVPVVMMIAMPAAAQASSHCLPPGSMTTGTFPFNALQDSNTCLNNLRAECCSGRAAAGSSCNCIGNPLPDTCVGNVTCAPPLAG